MFLRMFAHVNSISTNILRPVKDMDEIVLTIDNINRTN